VVKFPFACHKHFRTLQQAEDFIADWEEMYASIVKAKIKEELSQGYRPVQKRGTPVPFSLKTEGNDDEEGLADGVDRLRIQN
jgi:hypothetical protein